MSVFQDDFKQNRDQAFEGQISTTEVFETSSLKVETSAIPFGRAVVNGAGARSCANVSGATTAGDVVGFSVRSLAQENDSSDQAVYGVGDVASILENGRMFPKCVGGAAKNASVHVVINVAGGNELGQLRGTADGANTIALNQVKWREAVVDGDIGEITVHGILAS